MQRLVHETHRLTLGLAAALACSSCTSDAAESGAPVMGAAGISADVAGNAAAGATALGGAGRAAAAASGNGGAAPAHTGAAAVGGGGNAAAGTAPAAGAGASGAQVAGSGATAPSTTGASGAGTSLAGEGGAAVGGGSAGSAGRGGTTAGSAGSTAPSNITVWIAGDSTVANGETPCPVGWGADFQMHFNDHVKVVNSAVGGRSVRTWLYNVGTTMDSNGECTLAKDASGMPTVQARWQQMLDGMKPGDYLFIQFGINDSSATCDRHVGIEAFKDSYGMMAKAATDRGAHPIFLTPVSMIACTGSMAHGSRGEYVPATQDAGEKNDVPVIDLHQRSVDLYNSLGLCPIPGGSDVSASTTGKTGMFFCDDHTHFERSGAIQIGDLVAQALREQKIELAGYLK